MALTLPSGHPWMSGPPKGTEVCGGFDGSENDDWTAIKLETVDGFLFTPRYGPDERPAIWNPHEWGGRIPRDEVNAAWEELDGRYKIRRVYFDPGFRDEMSWASEGETWDALYGPSVFVPWQMAGSQRTRTVYEALRRFEADLENGLITHDGCPITRTHMDNARKLARGNSDLYLLGKPSQQQKIDAAVTSVLAHLAACDERQRGWTAKKPASTLWVW